MNGPFYDDLETRDPELREAELLAALPLQLALAKRHAPYFGALLQTVEPLEVTSRAALAALPVTRKSELIERQRRAPPFGGLATMAMGELARIFASPGPIYDPEGRRPDYWRFARALFAAGFRRGEVVHNSFSYHLTPAGSMIETAAHALGCAVIPGGVGQTEQQLQAMADLDPDGYAGTPSFLKILVERAGETGIDISSVRKALVAGEAFPPALRAFFAERGLTVLQAYGTADLGLIAYESPAQDGLILDERVIVEIVRPGTGDPVPDGMVGEVLVTSLSPEYPLIRFATGDLSRFLDGPSPCGRTNRRLAGWLGRADQSAKVKGMFVHPAQIAAIAKRHAEVQALRLVIGRDEAGGDEMVLCIETDHPVDPAIVAETLQTVTKLRGTVRIVARGSLPDDGKVIEDTRPVG